MEVFGVTKPAVRAVRASLWRRLSVWLRYECPWEGIGAAFVALIFAYLVIGQLTGYRPVKWGNSEKCWTSGGRSDDVCDY